MKPIADRRALRDFCNSMHARARDPATQPGKVPVIHAKTCDWVKMGWQIDCSASVKALSAWLRLSRMRWVEQARLTESVPNDLFALQTAVNSIH